MTTTVVNINDRAPYDVYIGRAGKGLSGYFGNPFKKQGKKTREDVIREFRVYFYTRLASDPEFFRRVQELRDKRLGCFCKPHPCHGDIIAEYLDQRR